MPDIGLRIQDGIQRGARISFQFDGQQIEACAGETVAAALLAAGIRNLRHGDARGMLCAMGVCQECLVLVDGRKTEACRLSVRNGMVVETIA